MTNKFETTPECARCNSSRDVHVSRQRMWERPFLRLVLALPFRCLACGWRGWRVPVAVSARRAGTVAEESTRAA